MAQLPALHQQSGYYKKQTSHTGLTTYETIDFETSQNLLVLTDVNNTNTPSIVWPKEFVQPERVSAIRNKLLRIGRNCNRNKKFLLQTRGSLWTTGLGTDNY
jgi:hypothetical protein